LMIHLLRWLNLFHRLCLPMVLFISNDLILRELFIHLLKA
jgi:hypothetical protein